MVVLVFEGCQLSPMITMWWHCCYPNAKGLIPRYIMQYGTVSSLLSCLPSLELKSLQDNDSHKALFTVQWLRICYCVVWLLCHANLVIFHVMHLLVDIKIGFCFSMDVNEAHLDCAPLESSVSYVSFKIFLCHRYCNSACR